MLMYKHWIRYICGVSMLHACCMYQYICMHACMYAYMQTSIHHDAWMNGSMAPFIRVCVWWWCMPDKIARLALASYLMHRSVTPAGHRVTVYWDAHRLVKVGARRPTHQ